MLIIFRIATVITSTYVTYCPYYVTSTISGSEVVYTYTSTSTVETVIPTTIAVYTTELTTCYETTEVYTTEVIATTYYTTVSAQSTIVVPVTITSAVQVTTAYTGKHSKFPLSQRTLRRSLVTYTYAPTAQPTVVIPVTEVNSVPVTVVTTPVYGAVTISSTITVATPKSNFTSSSAPAKVTSNNEGYAKCPSATTILCAGAIALFAALF